MSHRRLAYNFMDIAHDAKVAPELADDVSLGVPFELARRPGLTRIVINIPGKWLARTRATHEILLRFNWMHISLVLTVITILAISVTFVTLLLS